MPCAHMASNHTLALVFAAAVACPGCPQAWQYTAWRYATAWKKARELLQVRSTACVRDRVLLYGNDTTLQWSLPALRFLSCSRASGNAYPFLTTERRSWRLSSGAPSPLPWVLPTCRTALTPTVQTINSALANPPPVGALRQATTPATHSGTHWAVSRGTCRPQASDPYPVQRPRATPGAPAWALPARSPPLHHGRAPAPPLQPSAMQTAPPPQPRVSASAPLVSPQISQTHCAAACRTCPQRRRRHQPPTRPPATGPHTAPQPPAKPQPPSPLLPPPPQLPPPPP